MGVEGAGVRLGWEVSEGRTQEGAGVRTEEWIRDKVRN